MYSVVLGQCTKAMKEKLEAESTFTTVAADSNVISLLTMIREISYGYESQRYPYLAIHSSLKAYYSQSQHSSASCDSYMESFINLQEIKQG